MKVSDTYLISVTMEDSEDESLVVVFPTVSSGAVDRERRRLALQVAIACKRSAPVMAELDSSSSREFLQLAVSSVSPVARRLIGKSSVQNNPALVICVIPSV